MDEREISQKHRFACFNVLCFIFLFFLFRAIKNITNCVYSVYADCSQNEDFEANRKEVDNFLRAKEFIETSCNEESPIFLGTLTFSLIQFVKKQVFV